MAVDAAPQIGVLRDSGLGQAIQAGLAISQNPYTSAGVTGYGGLITSFEGTKPTFSGAWSALTLAATCNDAFQLTATTKAVRVTHLEISGIATTGVTTDVILFKRSSTGANGTAAANNSLPTAVAHDSALNPSATATVTTYTTPPTNGTSLGMVSCARMQFPLSNTTNLTQSINSWDWGTRNDQALVLRPGQTLALSLNNVTVSGGSLSGRVIWTEE